MSDPTATPEPESGTDVRSVSAAVIDTPLVADKATSEAVRGAQEAEHRHGAGSPDDVTVVHLLRHGEVHNPEGILYGRLDDFHLSELGREMADAAAKALAQRDVTLIVSSPLERAQETAVPTASHFGLTPLIDPRVIEAGNKFEGLKVAGGKNLFRNPRHLLWLYNPTKPSWGEHYSAIAKRMTEAVEDARDAARGSEAVIVSHQLPIWTMRAAVEGRRLWHDPRRRQCNLASLTSLTYRGDQIVDVAYSEPAGHLLARASSVAGA
ncbi:MULTISPECIES: histidine phosphatase family protein [unclassified Janibacter]|uniref:histidine phosphatase family protein n=1 Tax=unclassified Janibacter TaxID=2649294 RepID=UPI003D02665C